MNKSVKRADNTYFTVYSFFTAPMIISYQNVKLSQSLLPSKFLLRFQIKLRFIKVDKSRCPNQADLMVFVSQT